MDLPILDSQFPQHLDMVDSFKCRPVQLLWPVHRRKCADSPATGVELRKPHHQMTERSQNKSKQLRLHFSPVLPAEGEPEHRNVQLRMNKEEFLPKNMREF